MRNFTYFLVVIAVIFFIYSCGDDKNNVPQPFNHAAQAIIDNNLLVDFLNKNYYDKASDSIKPMDDGKIALFKDSLLKSQAIVEQGVNYTLYYYVNREGKPTDAKKDFFPTVKDSVFVKYIGQHIVNSNSKDLSTFETKGPTWINLNKEILRGKAYGFTHFKAGNNITKPNSPITYENGGKGILFIPSGLAYRNIKGPAVNANLLFYIDLWDVNKIE